MVPADISNAGPVGPPGAGPAQTLQDPEEPVFTRAGARPAVADAAYGSAATGRAAGPTPPRQERPRRRTAADAAAAPFALDDGAPPEVDANGEVTPDSEIAQGLDLSGLGFDEPD